MTKILIQKRSGFLHWAFKTSSEQLELPQYIDWLHKLDSWSGPHCWGLNGSTRQKFCIPLLPNDAYLGKQQRYFTIYYYLYFRIYFLKELREMTLSIIFDTLATAISMGKMELRLIIWVSCLIRFSACIGKLSEKARSPIFQKKL